VVQSVEARDGGLVLVLQPPLSDGGAPLIAYRVRLDPGGAVRGLDLAGPWIVMGLTNGQDYRVAVAATNLVGEGPFGPLSQAVTPKPGRWFDQGQGSLARALQLCVAMAGPSKYSASYLLGRHATGDDSLEGAELEEYTKQLAATGYDCAFALLILVVPLALQSV
jgi:hypothetical protein